MESIFRFRSASTQDPAIDAWLASRASTLAPLTRYWVTQLRQVGPGVRELLHDGYPTFCAGDIAFAHVASFSAHVNVGFYLGATLDDPAEILEGTGKRMRHVKLRPEVPSDGAALQRLIEDAYAQAVSLALRPLDPE